MDFDRIKDHYFSDLCAMTRSDLTRRLHRLRRSVIMLQTEFRREHLDVELIAELEKQMDHGISTDPACAGLSSLVDALRESTLTPRAELFRDGARSCEELKDAIEQVIQRQA